MDERPLVARPLRVQIARRQGGGTRDAEYDESLATAIAALATLTQWAGVTWRNSRDAQGRPITLITLTGVQGSEKNGKTIFIPQESNVPACLEAVLAA